MKHSETGSTTSWPHAVLDKSRPKHAADTISHMLQAGNEYYQTSQGKFGNAVKADVTAAVFCPHDWLLTGAPSGELLMWDVSMKRGAFGRCCQVTMDCCNRNMPCCMAVLGCNAFTAVCCRQQFVSNFLVGFEVLSTLYASVSPSGSD